MLASPIPIQPPRLRYSDAVDMALMVDIGPRLCYAKKKIRVGVGYQFWNNKFGNTRRTTGGAGQRASTPMLRADFHF